MPTLEFLLTCSNDNTLKIQDMETQKVKQTLNVKSEGHAKGITSCAPGGQQECVRLHAGGAHTRAPKSVGGVLRSARTVDGGQSHPHCRSVARGLDYPPSLLILESLVVLEGREGNPL